VNAVEKFGLDGSDLTESLDFRSLLASASPSEIEAACKYEYMRESQTLRDAVSKPKRELGLPYSFAAHLTFAQCARLFLALRKAGFPKPWKGLTPKFQSRLVSLIAEWKTETMRGNKVAGIPPVHPPLVIEAAARFDDLGEDHKLPYFWPENALEPTLFRTWGDREYFKGFIRIDKAYNETEAVRCFRAWFRDRYGKTKGGGAPKWRNKLKQLAVMRIWKHECNQWNRLKLVAKFCNYKGCVKEAAAYKKRCKAGSGDEPMSAAAKVEMSSAKCEARTFFQSLFPGEEPLSY
jgi:hypothetical protein